MCSWLNWQLQEIILSIVQLYFWESQPYGFWKRHGGAAENQMPTSTPVWPGICSLTKAQIKSLDYAISSCYRKIVLNLTKMNVRLCMDMFNCDDVDTVLAKRKQKLVSGFVFSDLM